MPFKVHIFQSEVDEWLVGTTRIELTHACQAYTALTTPHQKAKSIQGMMDVLDQEVDERVRWSIMEACGRQCIGASILKKARRLQQEAQDLDDLLCRLNEAYIGGGNLFRDEDGIHASYDRCYCGSVSKTRERFSSTYCHCSCGWYRQLFEMLLDRQVEVALLGSIIQGDDRCRFLIRKIEPGRTGE